MTGAPARVALVHDWLTGMRGGEKVLEEIADLFPEAPIYTLFHFEGSVSRRLESHPIHTSYLQRAPWARSHYRSYLPLFPAAIESFDFSGFDLIVSTSHCVAKGIVPPPHATHVCYCHTPMRYAWDQESVYFPRRSGVVARVRGMVLGALRTWDVAACPRVDRFIANSNHVASRIRRYYGRDAEVIHPPVDTDFFTPAGDGDSGGDYCLAVSALSPYKRLDLAIDACAAAGVELRIVGDGPERDALSRRAGGNTKFLGRVDDETLRELYRGARCLLQPGVEDFGITSVEALSCGTPVVALGRGGILDIVRDGTHGVLYPEEGDSGALKQAIDKSWNILFNKLNLRERAQRYSTQRFTESIRSVLAPRSTAEDPHS